MHLATTLPRNDEIVAQLRTHPWLAGASAHTVASLARAATPLCFADNTPLARQSDPPDSVLLVTSGTVRWLAADGEGRQRTLRLVDAPCAIGDVEALTGAVMRHGAETVSEVLAWSIPASAVARAATEDPGLCRGVLLELCRVLCQPSSDERFASRAIAPRLASLLLDLVSRFGRPHVNGVLIRRALTHAYLAHNLGVTDRSVRRVLASWREAGWLTIHKGRLLVTDLAPFERLAGGAQRQARSA